MHESTGIFTSMNVDTLGSKGSATGAETSTPSLGSGDGGDFFLNGFMFGENPFRRINQSINQSINAMLL